MQIADILKYRMVNQRLEGATAASALEAVRWLGAVQAQDLGSALWAVSQRTEQVSVADIEAAFARGDILRTHVMRPTWHLLAAEDIRWMLDLTRDRLLQATAYYYRMYELTAPELARTADIIQQALEGGKYLTRNQLATKLTEKRIAVQDGVRLAHIVAHAETAGLVCSGPMQGNQQTYGLLTERAPHAKTLGRDTALATLTERYFASHGPATIDDYVWWSGLTKTDAQRGLQSIKHKFVHEKIAGTSYWFVPPLTNIPAKPQAHFLPNYDEYIVAYADRSEIFNPEHTHMLDSRQNFVFNNVLVLDGVIAGTWKKRLTKTELIIELVVFHALSSGQQEAVHAAARKYAAYFNQTSWRILGL